MKQQRKYKEPQDTLWGKFLSGFMAVVFAMSTLTLIPIASAINGEPNEAQIQQQEELADQTSGKDEKAVEPAADEQKLEPVELLSIASVEDEDDADDAAPADVTLKVKAQNAMVTYNGNDAATELVVPADKDVKFTVKAADGFTLGAAAVKLADAKGETTLTPNAGEYTVAADRVADGATIVVTAEAVAGSTNTDAVEPSTPAPSTELGEKTANAESIITSIMSFFGGTSMLDARGWGNGNGNAGINPAETGSYPVYVYMKLDFSDAAASYKESFVNALAEQGHTYNGSKNNNIWYTIGKIPSVPGLENPINKTAGNGSVLADTCSSTGAVNSLGSISYYGTAESLSNHITSWYSILSCAKGADSYKSEVGENNTWHLNSDASVVKYTWQTTKDGVSTELASTADFAKSPSVAAEDKNSSLQEYDGYTLKKDANGNIEWTTTTNNAGDVTYTATYVKDSFAYTVRYYIDETEIDAATVEANGWTTGGAAEYGTTASVTPAATATIDEANYMLESTNHSVTIDANASNNVIKVVYTKDSIGTNPDPNTPDGVADKYQATIKYAAGANGSVTGTTIKVVTLMDGGAYVTEATITPGTEGVTVTPATGYEFDEWTDSDPEAAITARGGETYTYTANFAKGATP